MKGNIRFTGYCVQNFIDCGSPRFLSLVAVILTLLPVVISGGYGHGGHMMKHMPVQMPLYVQQAVGMPMSTGFGFGPILGLLIGFLFLVWLLDIIEEEEDTTTTSTTSTTTTTTTTTPPTTTP